MGGYRATATLILSSRCYLQPYFSINVKIYYHLFIGLMVENELFVFAIIYRHFIFKNKIIQIDIFQIFVIFENSFSWLLILFNCRFKDIYFFTYTCLHKMNINQPICKNYFFYFCETTCSLIKSRSMIQDLKK